MAQPPKSGDTSSDEINESSPTSSTPAPADETAATGESAEAAATSVDAAAQDDPVSPQLDPSEAPEAAASSPAPIEDAVHPDAPDASTLPSSFVEMGLPEPMLAALNKLGWGAPTKVQAAAFGPASAGRDVLVQSQTGSGKTGAFCIPWLAGRFKNKDAKETGVQLLVMTPTRELAKQVCDQLVGLAGDTPLIPLPVYGGTPIGPQFDALTAGVHAVVGTPGRILDHIRRRTLDLSKVQTAILDEADEMLSMGFLEDIHAILDACQKDRQTMLFSATVPSDIERIARRYMKNPESLKLSGDDIAASLIDHTYYSVPGSMRTRDLMHFIAQEEPGSTLIFCNTREETNLVANVLRKEGFSAEAISSDLSQAAREHVLGAMRKGRLRFLVATDVASRGIDITHISHVVNYSFP
ncbi:MAG: DEAD/DEAH box helicase, partial [Nannocystaceae bacterium]|nr:DEAD/DEAH box helicase [Nannocystaceae bacterium]